MTHSEHNAKPPSAATGLFARLRVFLRAPGSGARSSRQAALLRDRATGVRGRAVRMVAIVALIVTGVFAIAASTASASATGGAELELNEVDATRASFSVAPGVVNGVEGEWKLEYSSSSPTGPWTVASTGNPREDRFETEIRHLNPKTHYYARLLASGSNDKNQLVNYEVNIEFTTSAIAQPAIFSVHNHTQFEIGEGNRPLCTSDGPGSASQQGEAFCRSAEALGIPPTSGPVGLVTEVYANGADTAYAVEYSISKSALESGAGTVLPASVGLLPAAEESKVVEADIENLSPETTYYVRAVAVNEAGETHTVPFSFITGSANAIAGSVEVNPAGDSAYARSGVSPNGFETRWRFEYATSEAGPWTVGPGGTIPQSQSAYTEEGLPVAAEVTGLSPSTKYYLRLRAENEPKPGSPAVSTSEASVFRTSGAPGAQTLATHAIHGEAIRLLGYLEPHNSGLNEIQSVTIGGAPTGGGFTLTSGGQTVTGTATGNLTAGETEVWGVETATKSYDTEQFHVGEPISGPGIPAGTTISNVEGGYTGNLHKNANGIEERWTLSQPATVTASHVDLTAGLPEIPFDATYQEVNGALKDIPGLAGNAYVIMGPSGGPYTVEFINALGSSKQPLLEANASGLTPSGSVSVAAVRDGFGYATHYHFEYVTQKSFEEHEWAAAQSSPETEFGGISPGSVGGDVPGLRAGETYRYRLAVTNATPGNPVRDGEAHTLTVPSAPAAGPQGQCPNESFRSGPSANLPDCRAYEQVTPHDKEGAVEPFTYGLEIAGQGAGIGEDGEHLLLYSLFTFWGRAKSGSTGPYLFSRAQGGGWAMTAATTQPEAGPNLYAPELFSPDLTSFAFSAAWDTGANESGAVVESPGVEFKLGSPGGPYTSAVSVPRKQLGPEEGFGWVAASDDFSKLILASEDRTLAGRSTKTVDGLDLYEYSSSSGQLRQANVTGSAPGATIGTCGAKIVEGAAESADQDGSTSSRHAVSVDGSRVFFEAVPGSECSKPKHLFVRVDGAETLDLGPYVFLAANAEGSEVLLKSESGEILLYDTATASTKPVLPAADEVGGEFVSQDFSTMYFFSGGQLEREATPGGGLYREDLASGAGPSFIAPVSGFRLQNVSPDGRYIYFEAEGVGSLPGSAATSGAPPFDRQVFLYGSVENVVECVSCASSYDPEPKGPSATAGDFTARIRDRNESPAESLLSANGDYAFFSTTSALLPQDINEELLAPPRADGAENSGDLFTTTSSDVYEWRRDGVDGCAHLQGCIGLISSGGTGGLVLLLGSADDGRDVFFTTRSQLGPNDNDGAIDVYDARIDGGEPSLPARPVECEGDACSTPAGPPNDQTPSSFAFHGPAGAPPLEASKSPTTVKKKPVKCSMGKKLSHAKCVKQKTKPKKKSKKAKRAGHEHGGAK